MLQHLERAPKYHQLYLECRPIHRGHPGAVVLPRVAGDVDLEGHGPHGGPEVVEAHVPDAQPVGEVPSVGQGRGEADDPQVPRRVRGDEVRSRNDDLFRGEAFN